MQQVTINLPSQHPVRAMQGLARAIAVPAEHAPSRFPSFPALERTAVMAFTQPTSLDLPVSRDTKVVLSRQAAYPVWAEQLVSAASYQVAFLSQPGLANADKNGYYAMDPDPWYWNVGNFSGAANQITVTGANAGPLTYPVLGVDQGTGPGTWVWVPSGMNLYIYANFQSASANTPNIKVELLKWSAPGQVSTINYGNTVVGTNTGVLIAAVGGANEWYRPVGTSVSYTADSTFVSDIIVTMVVAAGTQTYTPSTTTSGTFAVGPVPGNALLPLVTSSEFANSQLPWFATRTTAAAFLGTNVTQILSKAGTVLGGRVSPNVINPFQVNKGYITALHPAEKAWLPLETGVYTYAPPSTDLAHFWDYTLNTSTGAAAAPVYRLDNDSLVNVMFITPGSTAEQLACTVSWHIEFRTSSALFQVALSGMTLESFHQAQLSLAAAGFFFDNPDHKAIIAKIIGAVNRVAPYAMAALQIANPKVGTLVKAGYNAGAALVSHMRGPTNIPVRSGPMRLPTTTAANSGITPRKKVKAKPAPRARRRK